MMFIPLRFGTGSPALSHPGRQPAPYPTPLDGKQRGAIDKNALSPPAKRQMHVGAEMPDSNVNDQKNIERDWCPQHAYTRLTMSYLPRRRTRTRVRMSGQSQDIINPRTPLHPPSTRLTHSHLHSTQHHKSIHDKTAMQIYKTALPCRAPHTPKTTDSRSIDSCPELVC